jgi:hypothetical protein
MESIIKDHIMHYLNENNLITKVQHGFINHKGCVTNLLEYFYLVTISISKRLAVDVLYTDFAKHSTRLIIDYYINFIHMELMI